MGTHLLYCSVLSMGGNVNARRMSQPDMGSIFPIKNQWNILVTGNFYVNYQIYQNVMLLTLSDTKKHWCIYSCLQIPPRENWFQYVRRVYATAIIFPSIITLSQPIFRIMIQQLQNIPSFPISKMWSVFLWFKITEI